MADPSEKHGLPGTQPEAPGAPPILDRIRGRRLFQWIFAYVAGAWIAIELTDFLSEMFGWSPLPVRVLLTLLGFGLAAAIIIAWHHGEKGRQQTTRVEVALLSGVGVAGVLAALWVGLESSDARFADDGAVVDPATRVRDAGLLGTGILPREASASFAIADPRDAPLALAVLPFLSFDGSNGGDAFADGVTEDILYEASLLPGLRVISRTSTRQYRGTTLGLVEIGRELDVDLILEGSARRVDGRARIVARLVDTRTDERLWSGSYDRELSDILQVQSEVAEEIARALGTVLGVAPTEPGWIRRVDRRVDPEIHAAFVEGRRLARSTDPAEVERGAEMLRAVVEQEPEFGAAVAALAELLEGDVGTRVRMLARETLTEVEETRPERGEPPSWQLALDRGTPEEAEGALVAALSANPNDAVARRWYGVLLSQTGRADAGLEQLRIASVVDPASSTVHSAIGNVLVSMGRFDEAVAAFDEASTHVESAGPRRVHILVERALARGDAGDLDGAITEIREIMSEAPDHAQVRGALGYLLALRGDAAARDLLAELEEREGTSVGFDLAIAQVRAALGDTASARALLDRIDANGWVRLSPTAQRIRRNPTP